MWLKSSGVPSDAAQGSGRTECGDARDGRAVGQALRQRTRPVASDAGGAGSLARNRDMAAEIEQIRRCMRPRETCEIAPCPALPASDDHPPRRPLSLLRAGAAARSLFRKIRRLATTLCGAYSFVLAVGAQIWDRARGSWPGKPVFDPSVWIYSFRCSWARPSQECGVCGGWPTGPVLEFYIERRVRFPGGLPLSMHARVAVPGRVAYPQGRVWSYSFSVWSLLVWLGVIPVEPTRLYK